MIGAILGIVDLFRLPLRWAGVDYPQFRALLAIKLTLDTQRQTAATGFDARKRRKSRNHFALSLLAYGFVGLFVSVMVGHSRSPLVAFSIVHAFVMAMVVMTLITDFSAVLLERRDFEILGARPVSRRTLFLARLAHIVIYLSAITLSLSAGSLIVGAVRFGWLVPPALLASLAGNVSLAVGITALLYLGVMRFLNEERVRDGILYAQIGMMLASTLGYQVVARLVDAELIEQLDISRSNWIWFSPPTWLAAPVDIAAGNGDGLRWMLTALGAVASFLALATVARLSSSFRASHGGSAPTTTGRGSSRRSRLAWLAAAATTRAGSERAVFEWTWSLCSRSRPFKRRTYPMVLTVLIVGAIVVYASMRSPEELERYRFSGAHLVVLYFLAMLLAATAQEIRLDEQAEAAWIYRIVPVARPGSMLLGGLKAYLCRFALPVFLIAGTMVVITTGLAALPDVLLAGACSVMFALMHGLIQPNKELPFSAPLELGRQQGRLLRNLGVLLIGAMLGLGHWLLLLVPGGVIIGILVALLATGLLVNRYRRISWGAVA